MSTLKRAFFCVTRKRAMSFILFAIILVVMLSVSTVVSARNTVDAVRNGQGDLSLEQNVEVFDNEELREWEEAAKEAATKEMVQKMEKLLDALMLGIFLTGFAVLAFVMAFRVQSRIHEFGILIANGISKWEMVVQNLLETGMLALAGFLATALLAGPVASLLVPVITGGAVQMENVLTQMFTWQDYIFIYGLGAGIILLSSVVSCLQIITSNPRKLLSKLS